MEGALESYKLYKLEDLTLLKRKIYLKVLIRSLWLWEGLHIGAGEHRCPGYRGSTTPLEPELQVPERCLFEELIAELWSFAGGACSLTTEHHAGPELSFLRFFFLLILLWDFYSGSEPILLVW